MDSQNCITFLNETGDVTITWHAESEAAVKALIAKKLAEGYVFFTVRRKLLVIPTKQRLSLATVVGAKRITMDDEDYSHMVWHMTHDELRVLRQKDTASDKALQTATGDKDLSALIKANKIALAVLEGKDLEPVARATTVEQVMQNQCVATKRVVGG